MSAPDPSFPLERPRSAWTDHAWLLGLALATVVIHLLVGNHYGFHRDELIVDFGLHLDLSDHYSLLLSAGRDVHNGFAAPNTLLTYAAIQLHL